MDNGNQVFFCFQCKSYIVQEVDEIIDDLEAILGCNTGQTVGFFSHTAPVTCYTVPVTTPYLVFKSLVKSGYWVPNMVTETVTG